MWARRDAAVVGTPAGGTITVAAVPVRSIAERIVEACAVPELGPDLAHPRLVADLLAALLADDTPGVVAALDRASAIDSPDVPRLANLLTAEPTTWRIETAWTDPDGHRGGVLGGVDCGALGTWEVSGTAHPLDLHPTTRADVWRRVVEPAPLTPSTLVDGPPPTDQPADHPKGRA